MEGSRLSRFGQQTLKNRNHFNLLQEIDNQRDYQPIINQTTTFLDETGQEISYEPTEFKKSKKTKVKEEDEMYQLPKKEFKGFTSTPSISQNQSLPTSKSKMNSEKQKNHQERSKPPSTHGELDEKKLFNVKKPSRKKKQWDPEFDLPGSDLYEIEDIIKQISSVMEKRERDMIVAPSKEKEQPKKFKGFKSGWNAKFNPVSKLDEMLSSYKTVGKEQSSENTPIIDEFYRSKKKQEDEDEKNEKKFSSFIKKFQQRKKPKNGYTRMSIVQIRWDQLPIIPAIWDGMYLQFQSFPQRDEYLKVVIKAIKKGVRTYSIFMSEQVGILKGDKVNDKNVSSWKLMSQEEYAKAWQQNLQNGDELQESQTELLMEFDIEWYRAVIEHEYHDGLEEILEKQYDIAKYAQLLKSIKRDSEMEVETIIYNQVHYLEQYFKKIYSSQTDEIMIGILRLNNRTYELSQQIADLFKNQFKGHTCILPFDLNLPESFVILSQLCGSASSIDLQENEQKLKINLKKPSLSLLMGVNEAENDEDGMIVLREGEENSWEVNMKIAGNQNIIENVGIKVQEQLLFGMLYTVDFDKL